MRNFVSISYSLFLISLLMLSCHGMKNPHRPIPDDSEAGTFITARDGIKLFVYELIPANDFKKTIYIISGITGINHNSEKDIIELLSNNKNRVVVIHPRGTGYSEGKRGDLSDIEDFMADYSEIIKDDKFYPDSTRKLVLYGHSMSCAIAIKVAGELEKADGVILVNPPYRLKSAKGMSPGFWEYLKYAGYYIFASHVPIVNMAGDPSAIENESDKTESELRNNDQLLVKYFSMRCMTESKKLMNDMVENARQANHPLLLLYGDNDVIVDKSGCDEIYSAWKGQYKNYEIVSGGSHGKSTIIKGSEIIFRWIEDL